MARRYFVDDSDNTISGLTDIDEVEVPTGYSAVLESTIRAVDPPGADGRIRSVVNVGRFYVYCGNSKRTAYSV